MKSAVQSEVQPAVPAWDKPGLPSDTMDFRSPRNRRKTTVFSVIVEGRARQVIASYDQLKAAGYQRCIYCKRWDADAAGMRILTNTFAHKGCHSAYTSAKARERRRKWRAGTSAPPRKLADSTRKAYALAWSLYKEAGFKRKRKTVRAGKAALYIARATARYIKGVPVHDAKAHVRVSPEQWRSIIQAIDKWDDRKLLQRYNKLQRRITALRHKSVTDGVL